MKRKNREANELRLIREGAVDPTDATATIDFIISEMAAGKPLQCQQHASPMESLFVFMANGLCATLHIQAFNPQPIAKGGRK